MKNTKLKAFIVLIFTLFFICNVSNKYASNYDYKIESYDININVNENNTLKIVEKIDVEFENEKHGIFRKIPLYNKIANLDGNISSNIAKISDIDVNDEFITYNLDGAKIIKIGNYSKYVKGEKSYTISYLYDLGKDNIKNYDELYFNIIGDGWDTTIENVSFKICMPKEFDKSKLDFYIGKYASINDKNIIYDIDGNIISGKYTGIMEPNENLTIRLQLPEGYFHGFNVYKYSLKTFLSLSVIIPLISLLIIFIIWKKIGQDDRIIENIEFYPPEGLNSAEVGYLYDGKAYPSHVASLLLYLANKGYIKIVELEENDKISYKFIKLKDYEGNKESEKVFLKELFKISKDGIEVTEKDLKNNFYKVNRKVIKALSNRKNKKSLYENTSLLNILTLFGLLLSILSYAVVLITPIKELNIDKSEIIINSVLMFIGIFVIHYGVRNSKSYIPVIIFSIVFITISFIPILIKSIINNDILINLCIGIISIVTLNIFLALLPKRSQYCNELLGKIYGYRSYIKNINASTLEDFLRNDSMYFYEILAYVYAFGFSNTFVKKMNNIVVENPVWFTGRSHEHTNLTRYMQRVMSNTVSPTMLSIVSSVSGSSSSGGGFAGGGSGGGGGGSW